MSESGHPHGPLQRQALQDSMGFGQPLVECRTGTEGAFQFEK